MGLRNSKNSSNSYDIAPVVSSKDFTYKKYVTPLPDAAVITEDNKDLTETNQGEGILNNLVTETIASDVAVVERKNEIQEPPIPGWVNKDNFKKLLLKTHSSIKDIIDFRAIPALAVGENYGSIMLRVKMTAKFENCSSKEFCYMLKLPPNNIEMKDRLHSMNFFVTENAFYTEVLPELEKMYQQAGREIKFAPESYRLELDDENVQYILLDDLNVYGFKNVNRLECLDMEHTLIVLHKMAQLHAASACRIAKRGSYSPVFSPDGDSEMTRTVVNKIFMPFKKPFLDNLKSYDNGEKYYDLMNNFFDNLNKLFVLTRKQLPGYLYVLGHGDCWSNNILFKYNDGGKLEETIFVDFQASNCTSPALDLYYFIISSVQIDIKISKFDYFIRYYHQHLIEYLKLLEYPLNIPNLADFRMQVNHFGPWATLTSFLTMGFVLLDPTDEAKLENFLCDSEKFYNLKFSMYQNERYRKYINEILPWLYDKGFMEIHSTNLDNRTADKLKELDSPQTIKQLEHIKESSQSYTEFVNESLFFAVVRADCENYQKILNFAVCPAINADDNYSSTLLKVDIDIELTDHTNRSLSYMLKFPPSIVQDKAFIVTLDAFEKETRAYFEIIPQLERMYKDTASLDVVFAPKSFKLKHDTRVATLALENFENCDRLEGLDMKHTKAVLEKLAQFHAASTCLIEAEGNIPEIYKRPIYTEERGNLEKSYMNAYLECVNQYEGNEEYVSNLEHYTSDATTFLIKASKIDNNKFNVLNHGDCWTNNIMFQHDNEGNIENTYFVDFQLVRYGSPCYDLFYFLLSSPKLELKLEHFDYFICYYHERLKANLELLKYAKQIPTLKDLHLDLLDNGVWAFYTVMCVLPTVLFDPSLKKFIIDNDAGLIFDKQMFLNKLYRSHVETILPWLNRRGLLEFN